MRIAVMGSGGLGGYFGALLARGGADVTFGARDAHLDAMRCDGLRIRGGPDPFHLEQLRPLVAHGTTLVSFQNGVLKDFYLRAAYDESHLIGGVAYVATTV